MVAIYGKSPVESYGIGPSPGPFPREISIQDMEYLLSEKDAIIAALEKEIEIIQNSPSLNLQSRIQRLEEVLYPLAQGGKLNVTSKALWQIYLGVSEAQETAKTKEFDAWKMMNAVDATHAQKEVLEGSRHFQRSSTMLQGPDGQPYLLELTKAKEDAIADISRRQGSEQDPSRSGPASGPYFRDMGYYDGSGIQSFVARKSSIHSPAQHWDTLREQVKAKNVYAMRDSQPPTSQPANIPPAQHWATLREQVQAKNIYAMRDPQQPTSQRANVSPAQHWNTPRDHARAKNTHAAYDPQPPPAQPANLRPAQHWNTLRDQVRTKQFQAMYHPQPPSGQPANTHHTKG